MKQVWKWQSEDRNWTQLAKKFSLSDAATADARFKVIEKASPKIRAEIDAYSRDRIVDENPLWVEEALAAAPMNEKTWTVSGNDEAALKSDSIYYRVENMEKVGEKKILTFREARGALNKFVGTVDGEYSKEKNPFAAATKEAFAALQKNPTDSRWIQSGEDLLLDQFKLEQKEMALSRTSQENWMQNQAFLMLPDLWSPIHVADDGQIVFFYLQEKKVGADPILDQLSFGKETLAADAKAYVTEKLLQTVKIKNAIVIPLQKDDE
jgi:hypothetical protein